MAVMNLLTEKKEVNRKVKKVIFSICYICAIVLLGICGNSIESRAAEILYSGVDEGITWKIDEEGLLTIEGSGDYIWGDWYDYEEYVKTAVVKVEGMTNASGMFCGFDNLTSVDMSGMDASQLINVNSMISDCSLLTSVNLSGWNAPLMEEMDDIIESCSALKNLNMSNMYLPKIQSLSFLSEIGGWQKDGNDYVSLECLEVLDLSGMDAPALTNLAGEFQEMNVVSVNMENVNWPNVKSMEEMFYECPRLKEVSLKGARLTKLENMFSMFANCPQIETVDLSQISTENPVSMESMFEGSGIKEVPIREWELDSISNMRYMFGYCDNLTEVDLSDLEIAEVMDMDCMFAECCNIGNIDMSNLKIPKVTTMDGIFDDQYSKSGDYKMKSVDMSGMYAPNLQTIRIFVDDYFESINLSNADLSGVTSMHQVFANFFNLHTVNLSNLNVSNVVDMSCLFYGCQGLNELDMSGVDIRNVTKMYGMFDGCTSLIKLNLNSLDTRSVQDMSSLFSGCTKLSDIKISNWNVSNVLDMHGMFAKCRKLKTVDISNFDTSKVTNMSSMFYECESLETIDVSAFDTSQVISMSSMFCGCTALKNIDVTKWKTPNVTSVYNMFDRCDSLVSLDLSNLDFSNVIVTGYGFYPGGNELTIIKVPANLNMWIYFPCRQGTDDTWRCEWNGYILKQALLNIQVPLTYTRISQSQLDNTTNKPVAVGSKIDATQVDESNISIPATATFTVTNSGTSNPTVAFDGVADENAAAVTIPDYITIDGVKYQVTTVSIQAFEKVTEEANYKVTDNSVKNLTVEYIGTTNKKKKSVFVPEYVTYKGVKFKVKSVKAKSFKGNKKLTTVKIASSITEIGNSVFEGCTNLKSVTLGNNLQKIGKNAFKNCNKLTKITIKSKNLKSVGKSALKGVHAKCKIKVPSKKVKTYNGLFKGKGQKKSVKVVK